MLPVCRFYARGPNSHFYTIVAQECAAVKLDPGWHYEGDSFFAISAPAVGSCASGTSPIYRVYNGRFAQNDSNHRFVVKVALYQQMIAQGWIGEGVAMCVSALSDANKQKTGQLIGGTWAITYQYGTPFYTDRLTFTGFFTSSTSGIAYAQGTNQRSIVVLGVYDPTLDSWAMLSPYFTTLTYPYDYYVVKVSGNAMTGCYYFVVSALTSLSQCNNPLTGVR